MKVYIQSRSGDHNLESEQPDTNLATYVDATRSRGGYFTRNQQGGLVFVPWHQIVYIEERV